MKAVAEHSLLLSTRQLRVFTSRSWYLVATLAQPLIWMVFLSGLLSGVARLPGFPAASYPQFLTPGMAAVGAMFGSAWAGLTMLMDLERGVLDRLLMSPVRRVAIITGNLIPQALIAVVQTLVLLAAALLLGVRYPGGPVGLTVMTAAVVLLALTVAALSNTLALRVRSREVQITVIQLLIFPFAFLSTAFMPEGLMASWLPTALNPVSWVVDASRTALSAQPDWPAVWLRLGLLTAVCTVSVLTAVNAFRSYQRSV
ncbi:ABC-2 type transport system permease protein [Nonomuraea fuscirosea]|uniref:Transport permease protein n=1 Tax=Nonomuraea fuscirosea TaxID=1291556 RepID=A0A2T0MXD8_9ACTN|nr:ABC transporter permease [Nonomuraea fuscirosea]PRX63762.1 ABC-2 type transport system permease protein [Nonomuraea fuscirosea]